MFYMKNITALVVIALCWTACKKAEPLPPPVSEDPVFRVTYNQDSTASQTVTSGQNSVYLFTDFEENDFVLCTGSFSKEDCPDGNCPGSLTFIFKSLKTDDFQPNTVFHLGSFVFENILSGSADTTFLATFSVLPNSGYNSFSWDIDSTFAGAGASIQQEFQDDSPRIVRFTAQKTSGLTSTVFRKVSLTTPGASFPSVAIKIEGDSLAYQLTAVIAGPPAASLLWSTGDTLEMFSPNFLDSAYSVIVGDFFGNFTEARLQQLSPNDLPVQTAGFTYSVQPIIVQGQPGEIIIQWVDAQGRIWRSDREQQPPGAVFELLESEDYEQNERGQDTRKMKVLFDCVLFDEQGNSLPFSGTGVIAVAHP
ncbi:MAG: hypothetical protein OHK0019_34570 [Saprospiraceae bacterium]